MQVPATKDKNFKLPQELRDLLETTRPIGANTLARFVERIDEVAAAAAAARDGSRQPADRFGMALSTGRGLIRDRITRAGVWRVAQLVLAGAEPAPLFRELCIAAAGALDRHNVDDLRGLLSILHRAGCIWHPADPVPAMELPEALLACVRDGAVLVTTPHPVFLARSDALRASGARGGGFAALCADGLGALVAEGQITLERAEESWRVPVWRPRGELALLISYT
jgi:hypothetical protein